VNYFDVLNSSLIVLLGQLVFEYHIAPSHLEPVAQKLNLNLVYNIVCNCCPKIPSLLPNIALDFGNGCGKNWGKIVLNNSRVSICKSVALKCSVLIIQTKELLSSNKSTN